MGKHVDLLIDVLRHFAQFKLDLDSHVLFVIVRCLRIDLPTALVKCKESLLSFLIKHFGEATEVEVGRQHTLLKLELRL